MAWRAITEAQFTLEGFNSAELAQLTAAAVDEGLTELLASAIAEWRGAVEAAGYELGSSGTVPDTCRPHLVARLRWQLLVKFPSLVKLQTDPRKEAAKAAEEKLTRVLQGDDPVEDPDETSQAPSPSITGATESIEERTRTLTVDTMDGI